LVLVAGMLVASLREGIVYALLSFAGFTVSRLVYTALNGAALAAPGLWPQQGKRGVERGGAADG